MRIFFPNASIQHPPVTGGDVHRYQLIKNWTELGHEVHTLLPDQNPVTFKHAKRPWPVVREVRAADVIYCRLEVNPNAATGLSLWPWRAVIGRRTVLFWEFNLSLTDSPTVNPRSEAAIERALARLRKAARRVDGARCVAEGLSAQVQELLGISSTYTIQNASDPEMFRRDSATTRRLARNPAALQVISIGSNPNSHHDVKTIVEAAKLIESRGLPIELHVFGRSHLLFEEAAAGCLHLHGPISYFEMPGCLAQMDVGLALYQTNIDKASPLKLFDYLAAGCVPVASDAQPVREVLEPLRAGLFGNYDAETLCGTLAELHENRAQLEAMRERGRRLIEEEYNWRRVAEKTIDAFRDLQARRQFRH
jgi:glycosyltransferase involved in cell wall biosynthesis